MTKSMFGRLVSMSTSLMAALLSLSRLAIQGKTIGTQAMLAFRLLPMGLMCCQSVRLIARKKNGVVRRTALSAMAAVRDLLSLMYWLLAARIPIRFGFQIDRKSVVSGQGA